MSNETIATETTEAVGELPIDELLSDGITNTPPSFVRAILAAASDPAVTSFAGGLPNPISFPQEALLESMQRVVAERGADAFQYSATAGIEGLRDWIARRYNKRFGTDYTADDVLITTGSQQILDLLGKVLLDKGDGVIVEKPTYLAAIQAFALNQPTFHEVELTEDGLNIDELNAALDAGAKMIYLIPNFQNPTGLTYSAEGRRQVREALTDPLSSVLDAIKTTLERTPPELSADIIDHGIYLTGGGALLRGLDRLISKETGMPVYIAENPLDCVALGSGKVLDNFDKLGDVISSDDDKKY